MRTARTHRDLAAHAALDLVGAVLAVIGLLVAALLLSSCRDGGTPPDRVGPPAALEAAGGRGQQGVAGAELRSRSR